MRCYSVDYMLVLIGFKRLFSHRVGEQELGGHKSQQENRACCFVRSHGICSCGGCGAEPRNHGQDTETTTRKNEKKTKTLAGRCQITAIYLTERLLVNVTD